MEVTEGLARFVVETAGEEIPDEAMAAARLAACDAIGAVFAGIHEPSVAILRDRASADFKAGPSSVIGTDLHLTPAAAAFANAAAAHALDYDSISLTVSGFVASPVLFPLFALAEAEGGVSGRRLLEAFAIGWEAECGLARAVGIGHYARGWHSTTTMGVFGATLASARLLGLTVDQTRSAIGIGAACASGLRTMIGNMLNPLHLGKTARDGVTAALLARDGFVAHPSALTAPWGFFEVFNGRGAYDAAAAVERLGRPWDLVHPGIVIKLHPCCGLVHSALDGVLDLAGRHEIRADKVRRVVVAVHELVPKTMHVDWPTTGYEAKFSTRFCVANALVERSVRLAHFTDERTRDPALKALMGRIEMVVHPELKGTDTFLEREYTDVAIELDDDTRLERRVMRMDNRGSHGRPASWDDLAAKFRDCVSHGGGVDHGRAFEAARNLVQTSDVREATACWR